MSFSCNNRLLVNINDDDDGGTGGQQSGAGTERIESRSSANSSRSDSAAFENESGGGGDRVSSWLDNAKIRYGLLLFMNCAVSRWYVYIISNCVGSQRRQIRGSTSGGCQGVAQDSSRALRTARSLLDTFR